eukprot:s368_g25.t1
MEVCFLASGEKIAVLDAADFEGKTGEVVKQALAAKIGATRFRQRLFLENGASEILDDDVFTSVPAKVQLVVLEFSPPDAEEDERLMSAARNNDTVGLEQLLKCPRSPNRRDEVGRTPLHYAARNGHVAPMRLLLEAGAEIDAPGSQGGESPLYVAAACGHLEAVRFLVQNGAQKDLPSDVYGPSPLLRAVYMGHVDIARFLLEEGASKDPLLSDGIALTVAARFGRWDMVRFLVAEVFDKDKVDDSGTALLHYATMQLQTAAMEYMQKMGLQPSAQTFLYGMRAAERAGEINQGLELFRRMKARGIKTNEKIDEALMRISLAANDPDRALQFFDAALQRRQNWGSRNPEEPVRRELGIYRQALRACELGAASGLPPGAGVVSYQDYALQLLLELQNAELPIDGTMYLHAVTTCEYQRSWIRVIALLGEMKQKGITVEGERMRSAYWNGVQAADEDDNVDQAFELFEQMRENKLTLEPFMYITMVRILEKHGQLARAHSVDTEFRELQMKEFSKELMTYRKRNEWQEAIGVLDKIREQNLTPTLKVFNTAMSALQRPGKWELVLELMEDMRKDGHVLDACSHTVAISAMISAGEVQRAVQQLQIMKQQKVPPTSLTYGRLIHALEEAGHPEQALYLWDELREKRIEPDRVAYEAAIRACHRCEFWDAILELFGEMQEKDKGPSKASRESASLAAERLGLTESVMEGAVPASDAAGMLEAAVTQ